MNQNPEKVWVLLRGGALKVKLRALKNLLFLMAEKDDVSRS